MGAAAAVERRDQSGVPVPPLIEAPASGVYTPSRRPRPSLALASALSTGTSNPCTNPSPDGTKIAFVRSHNNDVDGEIYTVNVDGTGLTQVTHAPGSGSPDWGTHPLVH